MLLNESAACTGYPSIDPLKVSFLMLGFISSFTISECLKQITDKLQTKLHKSRHFSFT